MPKNLMLVIKHIFLSEIDDMGPICDWFIILSDKLEWHVATILLWWIFPLKSFACHAMIYHHLIFLFNMYYIWISDPERQGTGCFKLLDHFILVQSLFCFLQYTIFHFFYTCYIGSVPLNLCCLCKYKIHTYK